MTREEILAKYPINNHNKTETIDEDGDQCTVENGVDGGMNGKQGSDRGAGSESHEHMQMQPFANASHQMVDNQQQMVAANYLSKASVVQQQQQST